MKKVLASLVIALMLINTGIYVLAAGTENTQQTTGTTSENISATLKMTDDVEIEEGTKEVKIKIGYGEIKGVSNGDLISFQGIITYNKEYFEELTQDSFKTESGYNAQYNPQKSRLLVESTRTPQSNEDAIEITFKLKENIKNITTNIEFKLEDFSNEDKDFEKKDLKANINVTEKKQNTSSTTKPTSSTNTTETTTNTTTAGTTNTTQKGELEFITTNTTTKSTQSSTTSTQDTTKTDEKELPKTGLQTVAIVLIFATAIGTLSYFKYKNIEIK